MPKGRTAEQSSGFDDIELRKYEVRISQEFVESLATIHSERILGQIRNLLSLLESGPELGSANVRDCLKCFYGEGIRKIPVSTFVTVYRFDGEHVDVLALVYGPSIV